MSLTRPEQIRGCLLLTRSDRQAFALASTLAATGYDCLEEPMLRIRCRSFDVNVPAEAAGLVFTSANAVDAFVSQGGIFGDRTLYAVGPQTAARLKMHSKRAVLTGDGDGTSLLRLIYSTWKPSSGKIVHVCGTHLSCDIAAELSQWGYAASSTVTYVAEPASSLSPRAIEALRRNAVRGIVFLSRRAAETFCALPEIGTGSVRMAGVTAFCFSEIIADAVSEGVFQNVRFASHPSREALLELVSPATCRCGGMSPALEPAEQGAIYQA